MKIGIDISQLAYEGGVQRYLVSLINSMLEIDNDNEYILFFSSLRKDLKFSVLNFKPYDKRVRIKTFKLPPTFLDILWNKLHVVPIEWLIGDVDIFISSDWTEPPTIKAKKATILYDTIVYKFPQQTDKKIIEVQKRKLKWVKKESALIFCISEATKKDAQQILGIEEERLKVLYPGV